MFLKVKAKDMRRFVVLTIIAGSLCGLAGIMYKLSSHRSDAFRVPTTEVIKPSGEELAGFFAGLSADPMFTATKVRAVQRQRESLRRQCGQSADRSVLGRLLSLVRLRSVFADGPCYPQPCSGSRWSSTSVPCDGPRCTQFWLDGDWNIGNPVNQGITLSGTEGCLHAPGYPPVDCPCNWTTCDNGLPPCEGDPCDPNNPFGSCPAGLKCTSGGCCADYVCPNNEVKCAFTNCQTEDPQAECIEGCCVPITCFSDVYCSTPQYTCVNQRCVWRGSCPNENGSCYPLDPKSDVPPDPCMYTAPPHCEPGWQFDNGTGCCQSGGSPILVDIEGDGFLLTSGDDGVLFDLRGSGSKVKWAWTAVGTDDAWLALDRNGNGSIDDGTELFGDATAQPNKPGEKNGFKALGVFDQPGEGGNGDGWIDQKDAVFLQLLLWRDVNHNGISEPEELIMLPQAGITAISLDYKDSKWTDVYGNQFRYRAKVVSTRSGKGKDKWAYDVFLVAGQ